MTRSVVITGASRGLGLASASYLYEQGWHVIAGMRSVDAGMRARGRGRIIAISSAGAIRGMPGISAYSASKGALERWAESLSQEIAPFGLGVTILVAGAFDTDILTEQTPDYGDHSGPYAVLYEGIHNAVMVRLLPKRLVHHIVRAAMRIPRKGALAKTSLYPPSTKDSQVRG